MKTPDQVYKIHIDATPEKVWSAIIDPEFTKQYWFGNANVAAKWEKGAPWQHQGMDSGTLYHGGIIEDIVPNERLVLSWSNSADDPDVSRVTFTLTSKDGGTDLVIIHGDFIEGSSMAISVSKGWPNVIANMKEFLEHGVTKNLKTACDCI